MSDTADQSCRVQTLVTKLKFWGETNPNIPAFIFWNPAGRRVLSRGDVLDLSSRFAYRLAQHGVKPKDVVCVSLPNSPERVVVEFGIQLAGAVSMNGQVLRTDGEDLISSLNKANCSSIVLDPAQTPGAWMICKHAFDSYEMYDTHATIQSKKIPSLTRAFSIRQNGPEDRFLDTLNKEETFMSEGSSPRDTCAIFTTSGSTGYSKLVPHTHEALLKCLSMTNELLDLNQGTKFFNSSPLGWLGGFPTFYLYTGCTRIALNESLGEIQDKPAFIWDVLYKENVKHAVLLPSIVEKILDHRNVSQNFQEILSRIATGGQPITKENIFNGRVGRIDFCCLWIN